MHEEIIWIGPAPANEDCAQVGDPDYARNAKAQCSAFIEAIRKVCGREPEGARLAIKGQPHDYGQYWEVAVVFDGNDQAAAEYAQKVDELAPQTWEAAGMVAPLRGERGLS